MKTTVAVVSLLGLSACHTAASSAIGIDAQTELIVQAEGASVRASTVNGADGAAAHRVLESPDGKILFQYDVMITKSPGGAYVLVLKPAAQGPTFSASRQVTVMPKDVVRVDLMEQPTTGRKIVDVFRIAGAAPTFVAHLQQVHESFAHWLMGR